LVGHVGCGGVADIGGGVKLPMTVTHAAGVLESNVLDTRDQPLDGLVYADDIALKRLMGLKALTEDGAETPVSSFNSSI
jgi:hypothetical protein